MTGSHLPKSYNNNYCRYLKNKQYRTFISKITKHDFENAKKNLRTSTVFTFIFHDERSTLTTTIAARFRSFRVLREVFCVGNGTAAPENLRTTADSIHMQL